MQIIQIPRHKWWSRIDGNGSLLSFWFSATQSAKIVNALGSVVFPRIISLKTVHFLKVEMLSFLYSLRIVAFFYFINWIVAAETIYSRWKLFKGMKLFVEIRYVRFNNQYASNATPSFLFRFWCFIWCWELRVSYGQLAKPICPLVSPFLSCNFWNSCLKYKCNLIMTEYVPIIIICYADVLK